MILLVGILKMYIYGTYVGLVPGTLLKKGGRREPGNIHEKYFWLLAYHHSWD